MSLKKVEKINLWKALNFVLDSVLGFLIQCYYDININMIPEKNWKEIMKFKHSRSNSSKLLIILTLHR